jgi:cardiolipin synthase (CMP-forming)
MKGRRHVRLILTYANQLTILRMIFIPCFVLLIIYGHPKTAALVFILAGVTDGLDGLLARKLQQKTVLGSYLDPMADKLLLTAAFVTLSVRGLPLAVHIPVWLTVLAISRDVLIALSALIIHLQTGHTEFPPSMLGKCTTVSQLATVGCCLLANFSHWIGSHVFMPSVYASLILTLASGLHYFYRSAKIIGKYQKVEKADGQSRYQNTRG